MEKKIAGTVFMVRRANHILFKNIATLGVIKLIGWYQYFISPFLPPSCRFEVSCSDYAKLVIKKQGFVRGVCLVVFRLLKCQAVSNYLVDKKLN
ncbi:MAG: membrane protein insertion efficiency factor YidD [Gammaproteobacteria bacterium]